MRAESIQLPDDGSSCLSECSGRCRLRNQLESSFERVTCGLPKRTIAKQVVVFVAEKIALPSALWVVIRRFIFRSLPSCAMVTLVDVAALLDAPETQSSDGQSYTVFHRMQGLYRGWPCYVCDPTQPASLLTCHSWYSVSCNDMIIVGRPT